MSKKRVLIVDDQPTMRHFCNVVVENTFTNVVIIEAENAIDAIEKLKEEVSFDLIISDYEMPGGNGSLLMEFLSSINYERPYIFHTSCYLEDLADMKAFVDDRDNRRYLKKPTAIPKFKMVISEITKETISTSKYQRIRIAYFLRNNISESDVFVKLGKDKFVKIIHAKDTYTTEDINKYINKKQDFLYISDNDFQKFATNYCSTPFLSFISSEKISQEDKLSRIHGVLNELVKTVGVNSSVVTLANSYMKTVDDFSKDNEKLVDLLFKMHEKEGYLYDHSYMTAILSVFIVRQLPWCTKDIIEKLCNGALFHDIILSDIELAHITNLEGEQVKGLSRSEINEIKLHPLKACELLKNEKLFSNDLENIIMTHHEKPDGSGFPKKLTGKQIRPLACVFILAHEFVRQLELHGFDENSHEEILTHLFNNYNSGNFTEVFDSLYKTLSLTTSFNLRKA